jgi:hypothetical protein
MSNSCLFTAGGNISCPPTKSVTQNAIPQHRMYQIYSQMYYQSPHDSPYKIVSNIHQPLQSNNHHIPSQQICNHSESNLILPKEPIFSLQKNQQSCQEPFQSVFYGPFVSSCQTSKDTSKDTIQDTSKNTNQDTSKDTIQDTSKDTNQDTYKNTIQDRSKDTIQDTSKNTNQDRSKNTIQDRSKDTNCVSCMNVSRRHDSLMDFEPYSNYASWSFFGKN